MPRLPEVPKAEADPFAQQIYQMLFGDRDPVAEPGTATGTPGNWWTVFALSPEIFKHAVEGFQLYRSESRELPGALRELGQARAGFARGSQFVFSQHCKAGRNEGLTEAQIEAIPHWGVSDVFNPIERAVLAYTDDLVLQGGRVSEATFDALREQLSPVAILELTYITCLYEMHATMTRALRLEYDDVDERIVEIAAPDAASSDVMSMVDTDD